jgi:hypothetical protein
MVTAMMAAVSQLAAIQTPPVKIQIRFHKQAAGTRLAVDQNTVSIDRGGRKENKAIARQHRS